MGEGRRGTRGGDERKKGGKRGKEDEREKENSE